MQIFSPAVLDQLSALPGIGHLMARVGTLPGVGAGGRGGMPVGVDLNSRRMRIAAVTGLPGALPRIVHALELHLPRAAMVQGEVVDPDGITDLLAECLDEYRFGRTRATVLVGGAYGLARKMSLPRSSRSDAVRAIASHSHFRAGADPDGMTFDVHMPDGAVAGGATMQVLGVAARRDAVRVRQQICLDAGMLIEAVDLDAFALYNAALVARAGEPLGRAVLVDLGADHALICVADASGPILVRTADLGLASLVRAISDDGTVTPEEAERILLAGKDPASIAPDRYHGWVDQLINEIRASASQLRAGATIPVLLSGYGPGIEGLLERIRATAALPVESLNLFTVLATEATVQLARPADGALFTLALGAALRQVLP